MIRAIAALLLAQPAPVDDALLARLREIDGRGREVADLRAEFEQARRTPLLKKPLVSAGRLALRADRIRWDTTEPSPSTLAIDSDSILIYYPDEGSAEEYPLSEDLRALTASPIPRLDAMIGRFEILPLEASVLDPKAEGDRWLAIELAPLADDLRDQVERIRVLIDADVPCIRILETLSPDGERTTLTFSKVRANVGVSEAEASFIPPPGTSISRPLGPAGGG